MGSIWGGFGTLRSIFWALLGDFGAVLARSKSSFFPTWAQDGLQEAFWTNLGWISEVWEGFWEGWEKCSTALLLHLISCAYCLSFVGIHFAKGTPALPRYAPRSVTIRGGSQNRYACWILCSNGFFLIRAHMDSLVLVYSCYSSLGA